VASHSFSSENSKTGLQKKKKEAEKVSGLDYTLALFKKKTIWLEITWSRIFSAMQMRRKIRSTRVHMSIPIQCEI